MPETCPAGEETREKLWAVLFAQERSPPLLATNKMTISLREEASEDKLNRPTDKYFKFLLLPLIYLKEI